MDIAKGKPIILVLIVVGQGNGRMGTKNRNLGEMMGEQYLTKEGKRQVGERLKMMISLYKESKAEKRKPPKQWEGEIEILNKILHGERLV